MATPLPARLDAWLAPLADVIGPVYPWLNGLHVLCIGLLIGAISVLDLRLLGAFGRVWLPQLVTPCIRVAGTGLAGALLTGPLLFSVQPAHYLGNTAFLVKLGLIAVALANLVLLRRLPGWQTVLTGGPVSIGVRLSAGVSLGAWIAALFAGRWIAFL